MSQGDHGSADRSPVAGMAEGTASTDEGAAERENVYRRLFEDSRDALVVLIPPSSRFSDANAAALRVFGAADKAAFLALGPAGVSPERQPDGRPSTEKVLEMTALTLREGARSFEWQCRRLNGETFAVDVVLSRVNGAEPVRVVATVRDISARKASEAALLETDPLRRAILDSINFSTIATDTKGVIQVFNAGAERMLGYSAAEVVGKRTPADLSDSQEVIERARALSVELGVPIAPGFEALVFKASRGIEDTYELTKIRKDGTRFPAVLSVTPLRDARGETIGYLLIGTDNTARKQIEAQQRLLDQRVRDLQFYTRSLIESNVDPIMTSDLSGVITDVNKQMETLTSCTRDELIGTPFKELFTDPERAAASLQLALNKKAIVDYELTARARDGKETVVSFNASAIYDRARNLKGVFAAARDVTELKRLNSNLEEKNLELENAKAIAQNAEAVAEKASLAKSEFLSRMSHELRSPLNAILGFAQLMESEVPPPGPTQKANIGQILRAGWHLLTLISEILDLEKLESKRVPISKEPVSLADLILEYMAMFESQAERRGIKLVVPQIDGSQFVLADRTRMRQVLINLLSNALKYNTEHGTIEVTCTESPSGRTRVSVRDTGAGLSADQLALLFQPFNRLGQETGYEEGTGIGLVVAKRLVELMGGVIGVESTVGVGSVFWFELVAVAAPRISMEGADATFLAHPRQPRDGRPHTLLHVEDNPANRKLVEQIVARHPDLRLLTAVDGNGGIETARASKPDVILLDINLPDINGFDVLKILRSDPATAHIPVIAITANAMSADAERGSRAGFFRYLTKPIQIAEFMETMDAALECTTSRPSQVT